MNMLHPKIETRVRKNPSNFIRAIHRMLLCQKGVQLLLVVFLHFAPICKVLQTPSLGLAASPVAIVLRWAAALAAMLGTYHTVSAASAAIVGLTRYTNNTPVGGPTNNAVITEGGTFRYRITVSNAGSDHSKDYFNCVPMPPGLMMNTNIGGNGFITNKPNAALVAGVYPVRLYAGNTSYPRPVTYDATVTVLGAGTPPQILTHPVDQIVTEGQPVTFTVTASGTSLSYQWRFNSSPLLGETNSTLSIAAASLAHAGTYTVVVSSPLGTATSNSAQLTVNPPAPLKLENPKHENGSFQFEAVAIGATTYILWASVDCSSWTPIFTNAAISGVVRLSDPIGTRVRRFYRLSTVP